ncbi:MAG: FecR domain-containing protein [Parabacteroides sp.]|nr:FecR domain-containing protein [Parabacteroides sp.]
MEELEHEYRKNRLSVHDLRRLREQVNAAEDEEIEKAMREAWMCDEIDVSAVDAARVDGLKRRIDARIAEDARPEPALYGAVKKALRVAAVILLPLFILATLYLYRENNRMSAGTLAVTTGYGERASVTLPDGTSVTLNANSELIYIPREYNKDKRAVRFEGEGYFRVSRDQERPFLVDAEGLEVKVTGTAFNLNVRAGSETAELSLEEGGVRFLSTRTEEGVWLQPGQRAVLNRADGTITVWSEDYIEDASAWKQGEMVFRNASFSEVIGRLEKNYGIRIETNYEESDSDLFTGTVPATDINEALTIIGKAYNLSPLKQGKEVRLIADGSPGQ